MKKMKQISAAVLALLLLTALIGCSKSTQNMQNAPAPAQGSEKDFTLSLVSASLDRDAIFTNRDTSAKYDESVYKITLADNGSSSDNEKVQINGNVITITNTGTYVISGKLSDGQLVVNADNTDKIQLVLDGTQINSNATAAIHIIEAKKVFITLAENSKNTLTTTNEFEKTDDNKADGVIYSKQDLTLNGSGALRIQSPYGHAIVCNDDLVITNGNYNLTAGKHCIKANDSISISGGVFDLTAKKDTFHCSNKTDLTKGNIYIQDCDVKINADDDAIHASGYIVIDGGSINISSSYEGIEAQRIEINGGNITLKATDDGLNASSTDTTDTTDTTTDSNNTSATDTDTAATADTTNSNAFGKKADKGDPFDSDENCYINIAGGILTVDADGDGIDSNGYFQQTGGKVTIYGAENSGNSALDYGITAKITGGEIVAFGGSGMAQGFSSFSTQCTMLINFDSETTDEFILSDSKNNQIISAQTSKKYNSVVVSSADISTGETYTATAGSQSKTIEMTSISYIDSSAAGGNKMFGGKGMGDNHFDRKEKPSDNNAPPNGAQPNGEIPSQRDIPPNGDMPQGEAPPNGGAPEGSMPEPPTEQ